MTDSDWLARVLGAMPAPISPTAADNTPADGPAPAAVLSQPENPVTKKPAKKAAAKTVAKAETSLVLRVSGPNGESTNGFVWPLTVGAAVEAPDWQATEECGHGLHGWLFGAGTHSVSTHCATPDAKWMVLEVVTADIIALGGKCKFPRGVVRFVGGKNEAAAYLLAHEPRAKAENCIGAVVAVGEGQAAAVGALGTATAGYSGTATAGDSGTATAGNYGTATAGDYGTATAGYSGTATAGDYGTATAGDYGAATAGYSGTATAGALGTATAGDYGTATAGDSGTATAGYSGAATAGGSGTATAGDSGAATAGALGTATAGDYGTATAGDKGELRLRWWDGKNQRYRTAIAYVGENGIKANVRYRLDSSHKFVEAK